MKIHEKIFVGYNGKFYYIYKFSKNKKMIHLNRERSIFESVLGQRSIKNFYLIEEELKYFLIKLKLDPKFESNINTNNFLDLNAEFELKGAL